MSYFYILAAIFTTWLNHFMAHLRPRSIEPEVKKQLKFWPILTVFGPRQVFFEIQNKYADTGMNGYKSQDIHFVSNV